LQCQTVLYSIWHTLYHTYLQGWIEHFEMIGGQMNRSV